jgi:acyl-coenzyme A thioesterase PaaI-like protein
MTTTSAALGPRKTPFHRWLYRPARFRVLVSLYPPLLGAGVRVSRIADDWTSGTVTLRVHPWTANLHGAAFGGALFSATDILYGMMLAAQLGRRFEVWTKSAQIEFHAPGRGRLHLDVTLSPDETEQIRQDTERDGSSDVVHHVAIVDATGTVVAEATHTMRVRTRADRPGPRT